MPVKPGNLQTLQKRFQTLILLFETQFIAFQIVSLNLVAADGIVLFVWHFCLALHFCHSAITSQR
jgi:hypothetical protein